MKIITDADNLSGKRVLVRCDFNVTIGENGKILDDFKIRASLPTIKYLLEQKAKIILMSHLGRPEGNIVDELRLDPIAERLLELLECPFKKLGGSVGDRVKSEIEKIRDGGIVLLENIQFNPGETGNDQDLAKYLASYADIFVMDAFGQSHREYASISGIPKYLQSYSGLLLQKEVANLSRARDNPDHPLTVVIGGAKMSTKIKLIRSFLGKAENIILGGALANTVLHAKGIAVGRSVVEEAVIPEIQKFELTNTKLHLPVDALLCTDKNDLATCHPGPIGLMQSEDLILDIGLDTGALFAKIINNSRMVVWNGPMGLFEIEAFALGTRAVAEAIADSGAYSIAGGGETVAFLEKHGLADKFSFVSTGGGAMMEFLSGEPLPALVALENKNRNIKM